MDMEPRGLLSRLLAALLARSQNALCFSEGCVGMYRTVVLPVSSVTTVALVGSQTKVPFLGPLRDFGLDDLGSLCWRATGVIVRLVVVDLVGVAGVPTLEFARLALRSSNILAFCSSMDSSSVS